MKWVSGYLAEGLTVMITTRIAERTILVTSGRNTSEDIVIYIMIRTGIIPRLCASLVRWRHDRVHMFVVPGQGTAKIKIKSKEYLSWPMKENHDVHLLVTWSIFFYNSLHYWEYWIDVRKVHQYRQGRDRVQLVIEQQEPKISRLRAMFHGRHLSKSSPVWPLERHDWKAAMHERRCDVFSKSIDVV